LPRNPGGFAPIELATREVVVVPASAPDWQIESEGELELIRITPRWPAPAVSGSKGEGE
jgi:mannose-6-phosphate isomerase